jgi:hypothetical protein
VLLSCRGTQVENNYLWPPDEEIVPIKLNQSVGRLESKYNNGEQTGMTRVQSGYLSLDLLLLICCFRQAVVLLVTECLPVSDE